MNVSAMSGLRDMLCAPAVVTTSGRHIRNAASAACLAGAAFALAAGEPSNDQSRS